MPASIIDKNLIFLSFFVDYYAKAAQNHGNPKFDFP